MPEPRLIPIGATGPEDVVLDENGTLYGGDANGRILRIDTETGRIDEAANTGGHPLGIELAGDGTLIVCDWKRGLLRVDPPSGVVETLVDTIDGRRLRFCNNSAVAADGTIYFSDSSRRFGQDEYEAELIEHSGTGRLIRRRPDGTLDVLLDGLQLANGVALAPDESFVLVAETGAYRLTRLWLTGERSGQTDAFVENLPAFPDNLSIGPSGLFWVAVPAPRDFVLDHLLPLPPVFRKIAWAMPKALRPKAKRTIWVMAFDANGGLVHDLQREGRTFHFVTGVREHEGRLYLGSVEDTSVAVVDLP
jgi:sugar lactone lactonase YvrE